MPPISGMIRDLGEVLRLGYNDDFSLAFTGVILKGVGDSDYGFGEFGEAASALGSGEYLSPLK